MKSKVHPSYKTKYRVADWPAYNQALVRRGDVTVWLSSEAIAAWTPRRSGRRGGQRRYSDLAIEAALTLRLLYHLPLRQAEGFLHALFGMMRLDLSVPDYTTLSRRSQHLRRRLRPVPPGEGLHLVLDSTGLSIVGAGEWAAAKHGGCGRRGWRKLHLGVDQSGVIRVHTLTEATGDDATTALDLLTAVEGPLVRVTADAVPSSPFNHGLLAQLVLNQIGEPIRAAPRPGDHQADAWHLAHRLRESWRHRQTAFAGPIEADETFMAGLPCNKLQAQDGFTSAHHIRGAPHPQPGLDVIAISIFAMSCWSCS